MLATPMTLMKRAAALVLSTILSGSKLGTKHLVALLLRRSPRPTVLRCFPPASRAPANPHSPRSGTGF